MARPIAKTTRRELFSAALGAAFADGVVKNGRLNDTGFKGYLAHEFVPTRDPLTSLREAVVLCDV